MAGRPDAVFRGTEQPLPPRPAAIPGFWPRRNEKSGLFVLKVDYRQVAGRPDAVFRGTEQPLPPRPAAIPGFWPRRNEKSGIFVLKIDYRQVAGRPECIKNKKSGLFVLKIDYRQVAGRPDAVFRGTEQPPPPPHGGDSGVLAAKKRKIWPFCLKNRLQTGGGTAGRRVPGHGTASPAPPGGDSGFWPRRNEKSGLFVLKIDYRQVAGRPDAVFRVADWQSCPNEGNGVFCEPAFAAAQLTEAAAAGEICAGSTVADTLK